LAKAKVKKFGAPDELRKFEKGKLQLVNFQGAAVGRAVLEPGWKWSKHVKPVAKTKSCEAAHFQYHETGILHVKTDDEAHWTLPTRSCWSTDPRYKDQTGRFGCCRLNRHAVV